MEKVIREGKVAVIVSYGFGAGWSTWNSGNDAVLLFSPKLVEMVEQGRQKEITKEWVEENLGVKDVYCDGAKGLEIEWVEIGTRFNIEEYDGSERLTAPDDLIFTA